ncbi:MAG TPA: glycerophosphodiester phosphodiesterase family protein [Sphingopyxis sp.]|nr:glycerophosphodiester phosphodiesterase family protein [Sphingopyxis sp.]
MIKSLHLRRCAVLAAAVTSLSSPVAFAEEAPAAASIAQPRPIAVIAHRGGALLRPENTMPAFRHAAEIRAEYLEFDMEMTADDRIAVYHDALINPDFCKQDDGSPAPAQPVRKLGLAAIQKLDCGTGVRPQYAGPRHVAVTGARVPELGEVLHAFKGSEALFFAETKIPKDADIDPVEFARLVEAAVRENGLEDRLILQSFDFRTIDALHEINPRIRTCLLGVPRLTRDYLAMLRRHNSKCIVLGIGEVDRAGTARLQEAGILVFSGVADREEEWRQYAELGVDALFTNDPEGAIAYLERSGLRN